MTEQAVDVVIPTRNRRELVVNAVRSVLGQTHRHLRVFVVDAGTVPPLELPGDVAADPRLALLRTPGPSLSGAARNLGMGAGDAPFVAFLDDDDEWLPAKTERQVSMFEALPESTALVACGFRLVRPDGPSSLHMPDPGADLRRRLLVHPVFFPSTVMVRRSAVEEVPAFEDGHERTQDWLYWIRLADRFDAAVLPEYLVTRLEDSKPPGLLLGGHRHIHGFVSERIDALPPRERERAHARHLFDQGVLEARCGRPREARRLLLTSLRRDPWRVRPAVHLLRTVTGERAWERLARLRLRIQARRVREWPSRRAPGVSPRREGAEQSGPRP